MEEHIEYARGKHAASGAEFNESTWRDSLARWEGSAPDSEIRRRIDVAALNATRRVAPTLARPERHTPYELPIVGLTGKRRR